MATSTVSEVFARPARTAIQGGVSTVITEFIDSFLYDMTDKQYFALAALLTLVISAAQALIENRTGKAILRSVPPVEAPVVEAPEGGVTP